MLTAMLLLAFVGLCALAIDLTLASASIERAKQSARLSVLSALNAYLKEDGEESVRIAAALARANEVAGLNRNVSFGENGRNTLSIGYDLPVGDVVEQPVLIPGRWHFASMGGENPCSNGETPPCFVTLAQGDTANAFRIRGRLYEGMAARFSRVLGLNQLGGVDLEVTASMVPRRGCFVVDLSPSITRQTHILGGSDGAEYAFDLGDPDHLDEWNVMQPARGGALTDPAVHYQDDYLSITTLMDSDYNSSPDYLEHHPDPSGDAVYSSANVQGDYLVDVFRDVSYQGPEPLTTILDGVRTAIEMFEQRAVGGDMACLIFYDNFLAWPRIVKLTDDFEYLKKMTDTTAYYDAGALRTDVGLGLLMKQGIFPASQTHTNTPMALTEALNQFALAKSNDQNLPSSDFVVLIGDGLGTCTECVTQQTVNDEWDYNGNGETNLADWDILDFCVHNGMDTTNGYYYGPNLCDANTMDTNGDGVVDEDDVFFHREHIGGRCPYGCGNDYVHYRRSAVEIIAMAGRDFAPNGIPIHVIHTGEHVAPHNVDIDDGEGNCLDSEAARLNDSPYVLGGFILNGQEYPSTTSTLSRWQEAYTQIAPDSPFYQAGADLYEVAVITRGIWGPLRPQGSDCNVCDPTQDRRLSDPDCRSASGQIADYLDEIMGQNPYVLVGASY